MFFEVVDQNCHSTYTYNGVQELKLLRVVPNSEISEMAARLNHGTIIRTGITCKKVPL